ncbi:MAG: phage minor capsid protein [Blautia sp.]
MAKINDEYDIGAAFEAIENELISSMIRNFENHKQEELDEKKYWSMWQTEMLKSLEKYKHDNQKKYGKQFKDINKQIEVLIRLARSEGGMNQEKRILEEIKKGFPAKRISKGGTAEFFKVNDRKLDALIQATTSDMQKAEAAVLRMANDQYRKIIYNAQVYANTGAGTYEKAVDMATKDFLSAGLNCIQYTNGARHTIADYADMAIRTASKRAYLQGEGEMRQQWGLHLVIMNKRGSPCPKCLPFVGKILIDDVWSGGSSKDGKYPLMSSAIAAGLYHPRCKDSHTTYFPGITKVDPKYNKQEIADIEDTAKQEAKQQYAERQEKRFGRLADFSLNPENQKQYEQMQNRWKHVRMRTGKVSSQEYAESKRPLADFHAASQNQVVSLLRTESQEWIDSLSEKEKYAIEKYTFNSGDQKPNQFFERLNAMLRGDIAEDKKLRGYAETISGALKKSKIEHDVIAYRNLDIPLYNEFEVNDLVTENQFISTSVVQSAALDKAYKVLIYVPKGSCCAYIEKISKYPKQRELLLDKNTIFRVISKKKNSIELQVIV